VHIFGPSGAQSAHALLAGKQLVFQFVTNIYFRPKTHQSPAGCFTGKQLVFECLEMPQQYLVPSEDASVIAICFTGHHHVAL